MRGKIGLAGLVFGLCGVAASAQNITAAPYPNNVYCSGVVTTEAVPRDTFIITGEESNTNIIFSDHDYVFINKGSSKGVKVGDEFSVIRPVEDPDKFEWTKWQFSILRKMGTLWDDEGRVKVVDARPEVSVARIENGCGYMQRADIVLPFVERPEPPLKATVRLDRFSAPDGKTLGMVITGQKFQSQVGKNDIVYVNLGNGQGVKVGDYFRIFRYTGTQNETVYQTADFAFNVDGDLGPTYGYGSVSKKYNWTNVPREVVGEGVVLRTGPNSATVLITFSQREIYAGDYVEVE
ncbi:MAG: hypothetical protein ABSA57_10265 [Candidatus Acidiferrales bacterium]